MNSRKFPTIDPLHVPAAVFISRRANGWRVKRNDRRRALGIRMTKRGAIALATRSARISPAEIYLCDSVGYSTRLPV